jgi:CheY-like chemotaxis protein
MSKVLIVEDEPLLRDVYEIIIKREGYNVAVACNGQEGLILLESFIPDVVLLDMLMPIKNGLELLQEANFKKKYPKTSVVILSNLSDSNIINSALKLGAVEHLVKSNIQPDQIVSTIKKYI